jgi:hypothetical protein
MVLIIWLVGLVSWFGLVWLVGLVWFGLVWFGFVLPQVFQCQSFSKCSILELY